MTRFDHEVDPDQVQEFGIDPMVLQQGVLANNLLDLLGVLWRGGVEDFLAVMDASLDENGRDGERGQPVAFGGDLVQPLTICPAFRQETDVAEVCALEPQAEHHGQKEIGMGLAEGEAAGVLLVDIAGQFAADGTRRVLPVDPTQEDREVPDVHRVLLSIVCFELCLGDLRTAEMRPCPVVFPIHDRHQLFAELVAGQGLHSVLHCIAITGSLESAIRWNLSPFKVRKKSSSCSPRCRCKARACPPSASSTKSWMKVSRNPSTSRLLGRIRMPFTRANP